MAGIEGKCFLIIDDDSKGSAKLASFLSRLGATSALVDTHDAGFAALEGRGFDAVISDNNMHKTGGDKNAGLAAIPRLLEFGVPVFLYTNDAVEGAASQAGSFFISKSEPPPKIAEILAQGIEDFAAKNPQPRRSNPPLNASGNTLAGGG